MRMTLPVLGAIWFGVLAEGALGTGRPYVDPPTPPACTPDGICYPKRESWGYYPARWRTWPGVSGERGVREPRPEELLRPDLQPYITPPPVEEDVASPPPTQQPPAPVPMVPPSRETTPESPTEAPAPQTGPPAQPPPSQSLQPAAPPSDAVNEFDLPPSIPFQTPDLPDPGESPQDDFIPDGSPPESDDLFDLQSFDEHVQTLDGTPVRQAAPASDDPPPMLPSTVDQFGHHAPAMSPMAAANVPREWRTMENMKDTRSFDPEVVPAGYESPRPPRMQLPPTAPQQVRSEHAAVTSSPATASPATAEDEPPASFSWSNLFKPRR